MNLLPESLSASASAMLELVAPTVLEVRAGNRGLGTGIAWGLQRVLTNAHVVHRAKTLQVSDRAGRKWSARVVRSDAALDLAVLEVPGFEGPIAPIGDSQRLRVGELVFAVGHPLGEKWLATAGVLAGRSKAGAHLEYLLSDVRLAPGNSGGPLFNASGQVIGINSMVLAPRNGFAARGSGIAMAIPGDVAHAWAWDDAPKLGITVQNVTLANVQRNLQPMALIVAGLEPCGAAALGGLQIGDVLLESRGRHLETSGALLTVISGAGSHLPLRVLRGGHEVQLEIPLPHPVQQVTAA